MRPSARERNELREIKFTRKFTAHAEGSVLVEYGETRVLCTASVVPGVPRFLKGQGRGWVTAEYGMLPRATNDRVPREAVRGSQTGRTQEIQRLIGRSLRQMVDHKKIGENTITIDCDVLQADGGTRTASISGGCVALIDALNHMQRSKMIKTDPLKFFIASVSVGIYKDLPILDLDYIEDSNADTDMNIVMTDKGEFVEIQGTAEKNPLQEQDLHGMLSLAKQGVFEIIRKQKAALSAG